MDLIRVREYFSLKKQKLSKTLYKGTTKTYGEKFGNDILPPYTKEEVDSWNVKMPQDLYDYLINVSKEIYCESYDRPEIIIREHFLTKEQYDIKFNQIIENTEGEHYNEQIKDRMIQLDCITIGVLSDNIYIKLNTFSGQIYYIKLFNYVPMPYFRYLEASRNCKVNSFTDFILNDMKKTGEYKSDIYLNPDDINIELYNKLRNRINNIGYCDKIILKDE